MALSPVLTDYLQAGAFTRPQAELLTAVIDYFAGLTDGAYAPIGVSYVVLGASTVLTDERIATAGTGIDFADGGAGSTWTITVDLGDFTTSDLAEGTNLYYTDERVDDRVSALLVAGSNITITYDDPGNTLTIATTGLAPSSAQYLTIGNDAGLSAERAIAFGTGLSGADGGANSTYTISLEAGLVDIAGLAKTDSNIIVGNGTNWVAESGATARTSLGLAIGTNVQAWSANLDEYSAVNPSADAQAMLADADVVRIGDSNTFTGATNAFQAVTATTVESTGSAAFATSSGSVGIGTASPIAKLSVVGTKQNLTSIDNYNMGLIVEDSTAQATGVGGGISFRGNRTNEGLKSTFASIDAIKENSTSGDYRATLRFSTANNAVGYPEGTGWLDSAGNFSAAGAISATTSIKPGSYTVATLPSAAAEGRGSQVYCTNETGGEIPVFSDGTNWRRVTDRSIAA